MTVAPLPVVVAFRDTSIGYDASTVIHALDLEIRSGEVIGVLGPNGSGKSTLIRGLLGLARIQQGTIEVFGVERSHVKDWHRVGYVPQRGTVTGGIPSTVHEVVASGRLTTVAPFRRVKAADRQMIRDAIDAVGLASKAQEAISTLSGGQQRRALIARALATAPDLLVLDEPTAGVDAENQEVLAGVLADLASQGTTIILITHELGPAEPVVTRTLVLNAGRIIHDGPSATAPSEHDDAWHHDHGTTPEQSPGRGLGLEGIG